MKQYFVYIVECSDKSFYTGITNDLERRTYEHNSEVHIESYCYSRRPVRLVFSQDFNNVDQAIAREKQIKGWSHAKKVALINGDWDKLVKLSNAK